MRKVPSVCSYFVIASGTSTTQVRAIADHITEQLKHKGQRRWHVEGEREGLWILLDYGDVVAHVFLEEMRRFYRLERLWGDRPQARYAEGPKKGVKKARRKKVVRRKKKAAPRRRKAVRRKR